MLKMNFISHFILLLIIPALSSAITWDRGEDRYNFQNSNPHDGFTLSDNLSIDCVCAASVSETDLEINVIYAIASGSIFSTGINRSINGGSNDASGNPGALTKYGTNTRHTAAVSEGDKCITSAQDDTFLSTAPKLIYSRAITEGNSGIGNSVAVDNYKYG